MEKIIFSAVGAGPRGCLFLFFGFFFLKQFAFRLTVCFYFIFA